MGFIGDLVQGLLKVFCGSQQETSEPVQPGPGRPTYAQQAQQPVVHQVQPQYPPQQQWQAPQQPPASAHPQQQQHARPHPHKPHHGHGHGSQGQGQQGTPLGLPSQNQWTSSPSPPQSPLHHPASPARPTDGRVDQNLVNQQNEYYVTLRARANREGDAMARAFEESHAAYGHGDGGAAKELSNQGKTHQREMERLNAEASAWIFRENNLDSRPGEVDLHGLYVKEAIAYTDQSISEAQARGDKEVRLIVGKGIHSANHAAKLKPAIEELMLKHNLAAALDPDNSGVLVVQLEGGNAVERARDRGGVVLGADDIMRRLDSRDDGCIVM
ncbi:hypothetical protein EDB84DRAFT_1274693 [Lactarius hengduanensis]|nr:hypothetical protein EDB84DRAFT_1274693 [Lactarius hengduanensis]